MSLLSQVRLEVILKAKLCYDDGFDGFHFHFYLAVGLSSLTLS